MLLALAVGLITAIAVPVTQPGIGWLIGFLAVAALVFRRRRSWWLIPALLLALLALWRSAGWIFSLAMIAAFGLLAVTVRNGRSHREIWSALPLWLTAGLRAVPDATRALASSGHRVGRMMRGIIIGIALLGVFGWLLASADHVFAGYLHDLKPDVTLGRLAGGAFVFLVTVVVCVGIQAPDPAETTAAERAPWRLSDWAIPLGLLNTLFVAFCIVQFTVLFGGHYYVHDNGPTYAQYARSGFLQLGLVTLLTLLVVAVIISRLDPRHLWHARILGGVLCCLTLVVVLSALRRMQVYTQAFGFTRSRLLSTALIVWLALILIAVVAVGFNRWRPLLARLVLGTGVLVLFGLLAINPDRYIAETVIGRYEHDGHLDAPYLTSLSPDALFELDRLPEPKRSCIASRILSTRHDSWYAFSPPRAAARTLSISRAADFDCARYLAVGYRYEGNWVDPK
ncbi:hypothetical protein Rhe02_59080 [Rhizocola hellebori]|uniref:DUF4173 domain-containing protein n=1 Tax=Rhizocola hellebori TaxID=1392758 RepID=A0A8J3VJ93_9ACTN|nr:DUF4173 domain-containing protein [Rhizocola hellebori]GIH07841.1 hypothetical protein Rhe02_59080 [Rhizocola hellebori]